MFNAHNNSEISVKKMATGTTNAIPTWGEVFKPLIYTTSPSTIPTGYLSLNFLVLGTDKLITGGLIKPYFVDFSYTFTLTTTGITSGNTYSLITYNDSYGTLSFGAFSGTVSYKAAASSVYTIVPFYNCILQQIGNGNGTSTLQIKSFPVTIGTGAGSRVIIELSGVAV